MPRKYWGVLFYWIVLPVLVLINLSLGLVVLSRLNPVGWLGWMELGAGAFCCVVTGVLAAAGWSRSYWGTAMNRQVTRWRRMADVIFRWLEDVPVSPDAMRRLQGSLDNVISEEEREELAHQAGSVSKPHA